MSNVPPSGSHMEHHLSSLARKREPSPLKALYKYSNVPDMINMAGGMPSASLFPYETLEATFDLANAFPVDPSAQPSSLSPWSWLLSWFAKPSRTSRFSIPKRGQAGSIDITSSLQYSSAMGFPQLRDFLLAYTRLVHRPPVSAGHMVLVNTGNTDGWAKCVATFCEPGEAILCEAYTYPSALYAALPWDIVPVGLEMDGEGITPESLDRTMRDWRPQEHEGRKKPHVLYCIPVGQNPTGASMSLQRKRRIYDLCCEHDILILEDDPYHALQFPVYGSSETTPASLIPSFLNCDVEGRVVRMDTISKTIAPGSRLGWLTCNELFGERILRAAETTTSMPCGFAQAMITQLVIHEWKMEGWTRWIDGLRAQYTARRDCLLDLLHEHFDLRHVDSFSYGAALLKPSPGFLGYARSKSEKRSDEPLIGFVPPVGGMFVWVRCYLEQHPDFARLALTQDAHQVMMERLFVRLAEKKVLVCPGYFFDPEPSKATASYVRIAFPQASRDEMARAVRIFAKELALFVRGA